MHIKNITLDYLKPFKSTEILTLTCDSCQGGIKRTVKSLRRCVKEGQQNAYCSNKCQAKITIINKDKICENCNKQYTRNFPEQRFCGVSCGMTGRTKSEETKHKISVSVKKYAEENKKDPKPFTETWRKINIPKNPSIRKPRISKIPKYSNSVEFSKLFICKCKKCNFVGSYRVQRLYCSNCENYYTENGRSKYIFTFNVYNYPDLFDLSLIEQYGWRKTKGTNLNINGISRDHKVSVRDALLNNYDPYYIKHPLNCELMRHSDNQSKGTKSSLTYEELVKLVDEYESK